MAGEDKSKKSIDKLISKVYTYYTLTFITMTNYDEYLIKPYGYDDKINYDDLEITEGSKFKDWDGKTYKVWEDDDGIMVAENIKTGAIFTLESFKEEDLEILEYGEQPDNDPNY